MKGSHIVLLALAVGGAAWWLSRRQTVTTAMPPPVNMPSGAQYAQPVSMPGGTLVTAVPEDISTGGPSIEDIATEAPIYRSY